MDEARLIERLRLIEALHAGAAIEGERNAAERARGRILERLQAWQQEDPLLEYRFTLADMWSRKVFVALLRRYGIRPYRYSRQRRTTVMAKLPRRFVDEALWPEFQEISETLRTYLSDVTERVVRHVFHPDSSEAEVIEKPEQLPVSTDEAEPAPGPTSPAASQGQPERPAGQATASAGTRDRTKKRRGRRKRKRR